MRKYVKVFQFCNIFFLRHRSVLANQKAQHPQLERVSSQDAPDNHLKEITNRILASFIATEFAENPSTE